MGSEVQPYTYKVHHRGLHGQHKLCRAKQPIQCQYRALWTQFKLHKPYIREYYGPWSHEVQPGVQPYTYEVCYRGIYSQSRLYYVKGTYLWKFFVLYRSYIGKYYRTSAPLGVSLGPLLIVMKFIIGFYIRQYLGYISPIQVVPQDLKTTMGTLWFNLLLIMFIIGVYMTNFM